MDKLLAITIISLCNKDYNIYTYHSIQMNCKDFYVNCIVDEDFDILEKNKAILKKAIDICKNKVVKLNYE